MNLCSSGHEEVCYEGRSCPACQIVDEKKDLEREIRELQDDLRRSEDDVRRLMDED